MIELVTVDAADYCPGGWPAEDPCNYTGGHFCSRAKDHKGRHRCDCGAETRRKDALPTESDR